MVAVGVVSRLKDKVSVGALMARTVTSKITVKVSLKKILDICVSFFEWGEFASIVEMRVVFNILSIFKLGFTRENLRASQLLSFVVIFYCFYCSAACLGVAALLW